MEGIPGSRPTRSRLCPGALRSRSLPDTDETEIRREGDGSWLIDGAVHVEKLNELFGVEFEERDFDTVGGLVVSQLGRVPRQGESVVYRTLTLEVLAVDGRRIRLVRARCSPASENTRAQS